MLNSSYIQSPSNGKESHKRESEAEREERRAKRRRSRWGGDEKEKTFIPGMPTVLPTNLSKEQEEAYLVQLQIEEISRKLRTGELGIPINPEERCASCQSDPITTCVQLSKPLHLWTRPQGMGLRCSPYAFTPPLVGCNHFS